MKLASRPTSDSICPTTRPALGAAMVVVLMLLTFSWTGTAQADCRFSSTAFPTMTPLTVGPDSLALNGAAFCHHGNVMAAGKIDNLILFHVDGEIIPQVSNIVSTHLDFVTQIAAYVFQDASQIKIDISPVNTLPRTQQNVRAIYIAPDNSQKPFFLICQ